MDTLSAFAMGQAYRGKPMMVFDWNKAAALIVEHKATAASAGLSGDWEWTGGSILTDGKPTPEGDTYTYLASPWATPELEIDGDFINCFVMEEAANGWDAKTYWPESALAILNANAQGKPAEPPK